MELYQPMINGNFYSAPQNHVRWNQTLDSHIFTAHIPGVRKEEIRVEVEDRRYMVIRTDLDGGGEAGSRSFARKFRLPATVNLDGISAAYEDGVLTVRVPRSPVGRRPSPADVAVDLSAEDGRSSVARAA